MRRLLACAAGALGVGVLAPGLAPDADASATIVPRVASDPVELELAPVMTAGVPDEAPATPTRARASGTRVVVSTGYCLSGTTASGGSPGPGQVAMNGVPLGSRWRVTSGPLAGATFVATDRIGHGTDFDIWFPTCAGARAYGRLRIEIEPRP